MTVTASHIDQLRERLGSAARDLRLNIQAVLRCENLNAAQTYGCALTSAWFIGADELAKALLADAQAAGVDEASIDDAKAAASLMSMNTVFYRFRHLVQKPGYEQRPARLRMSRMVKPATSKADFELFAMAAAVLAGCETCIRAHEASILKHGLGEEHVQDVVRIASVICGFATALRV